MFGLDVDTLRKIRACFEKLPNIQKVLIYGSRAKGNYKSGSDIDITLLGKELTLDNSVYPLMRLLEDLPYKFDISIFSQLDSPIVDHILRAGKTLYEIGSDVLPEYWRVKKLGEVCEIVNGGTPKSSVSEYWGGDVQWLTPKDMGRMSGRFIKATPRTITESGLSKSSANLIPPDSVILSTRAPIGHLAINQVTMAFNQGCRGLIPRDTLAVDYLYYFLLLNRPHLDGMGAGTTFKELSGAALKSIKTPIPPLSEQRAIVSSLDKAFTAIDKAKGNLEKSIQNTRKLFQGKLNAIFTKGRTNPRWKMKKLGEVCEVIAGQSPASKFYNIEGKGLPFYQGKKDFGEKYLGKPTVWTTKITKEASDGDILMSVRAPVGPVNLATEKICIGRGLAGIRTDELIDKGFLFYFLTKHESEITGSSGTVFNSINKTQISDIPIPLPPLPEQKQIAAKLGKLSEQTKSLTLAYQQKLDSMEKMKKSLLQQAFRGQLV